MEAVLPGTWTGCVHFCLLFGAVASVACLGMCGIFKTDFHAIRFEANIECKQNVGQVSIWRASVLHEIDVHQQRMSCMHQLLSLTSLDRKMLASATVCPAGLVFLIAVSTFDNAKFSHGSEIWRNANLHQLRCPLAFVPDTDHLCGAAQWRTYYLPCRTSIAIVAPVNSQRTLSFFVDENILKKQ